MDLLKITPKQVDAMTAALADGRTKQFSIWMREHASVVGYYTDQKLSQTLATTADEATRSGIDTDIRAYIYAASRLLMPTMNPTQYVATMDIVFGSTDDAHRLRNLVALRQSAGG